MLIVGAVRACHGVNALRGSAASTLLIILIFSVSPSFTSLITTIPAFNVGVSTATVVSGRISKSGLGVVGVIVGTGSKARVGCLLLGKTVGGGFC